jgi:hypothetical protein
VLDERNERNRNNPIVLSPERPSKQKRKEDKKVGASIDLNTSSTSDKTGMERTVRVAILMRVEDSEEVESIESASSVAAVPPVTLVATVIPARVQLACSSSDESIKHQTHRQEERGHDVAAVEKKTGTGDIPQEQENNFKKCVLNLIEAEKC